MSLRYTPTDWYWLGPLGLYSSAASALVALTDSAYLAWLTVDARRAPTPWPQDDTGAVTTAALDEVLVAAGLPATGLTPMTKLQLLAYANKKLISLMATPRSYGPLGTSGPTVLSDATAGTGADLAGINAWGTVAPTATTSWVDDFGSVTTITGAQGCLLAAGVIAFGQSLYDILGTAATQITAGTMTTAAQIDAMPWPV